MAFCGDGGVSLDADDIFNEESRGTFINLGEVILNSDNNLRYY